MVYLIEQEVRRGAENDGSGGTGDDPPRELRAEWRLLHPHGKDATQDQSGRDRGGGGGGEGDGLAGGDVGQHCDTHDGDSHEHDGRGLDAGGESKCLCFHAQNLPAGVGQEVFGGGFGGGAWGMYS